MTVGVEYGHDSFRYRFENPSRFNTTDTVPHFFEQHYDVSHSWLSGRARYRFAGRAWETAAGIAPSATGVGSDYDTFFNPDGNVIVYGTTADTSALSLIASQTVELGAVSGFRARIGYTYRRDRTIFHDSLSTTTQTLPASQSGFWNTGRETTISETHEVRVGVTRDWAIGGPWRVSLLADVSPATLARLTTLLQDKYPDQPIVFIAKAYTLDAAAWLDYRRGPLTIDVHGRYSGGRSYTTDSLFQRQGWALGVSIGRVLGGRR